MKVTKRQLKKIIKEELKAALSEEDYYAHHAGGDDVTPDPEYGGRTVKSDEEYYKEAEAKLNDFEDGWTQFLRGSAFFGPSGGQGGPGKPVTEEEILAWVEHVKRYDAIAQAGGPGVDPGTKFDPTTEKPQPRPGALTRMRSRMREQDSKGITNVRRKRH